MVCVNETERVRGGRWEEEEGGVVVGGEERREGASVYSK